MVRYYQAWIEDFNKEDYNDDSDFEGIEGVSTISKRKISFEEKSKSTLEKNTTTLKNYLSDGIDSDEEELIRFTIILIHDEYHLLVDIGIRDDHLDIMNYYINTEEDINDIPNTLPLERKDCGSWRDIISIWISELKRIADEGWELFS